MVKVLNVAEKNNVAKGVAQLLSRGRMQTRNGKSVYNKIYEFPFTFMGRQCTMVVTSVSGHLLHLDFNANYKHWNTCNPIDLFQAPVQKSCSNDYVPIKETLEREVRGCNVLVIWTDCDREGENIGFEIIDVCTKVKPNLDIYRAKFSEVTQRAIQSAVQDLQRPNKRLNDAVNVRIELDLRIGASFTRFQTLRFQKVFPASLSNCLISYGSCQFPTLGFVVERYKQIKEFICEPFWKLRVSYKTKEGEDVFAWERGRLFERSDCQIYHQMCLKTPTATVLDVKGKQKSKWRPLPLETVELQKLASRKLKMNAQMTMNIAEKLYTQGIISYPRTETNIFPKSLDLRPLIEMQTANPQWGAFATKVLDDGPNPRKGTKTDEAHPPIHPTKYTDNLEGNEKRLYEFIVRHFLACVSKDAEGFETTVLIDIAQEQFSASGLMITARNYLEVYPYDKWSDKNIQNYTVGQNFEPTEILMIEGSTEPPPLLTEADLIALMEKHGIGTDATHAEHIETVKKRQYVSVQENKFLPGKLGMGLAEAYDAIGLEMSKPNLRAALERDLKKICDGQADPAIVLRNQIEIYKNVFIKSIEKINVLDATLGKYLDETVQEYIQPVAQPTNNFESVMKCVKCNSDMNLKSKRDGNGFYISCSNYPNCKYAIWFPSSVKNVSVANENCENCRPHTVKKLNFVFTPKSFFPYYPDNFTGCVGGCNSVFMETLGISGRDASTTTPNTSRINNPLRNQNTENTKTKTRLKRTVTKTISAPAATTVSANPDTIVVCNCGEEAVTLTVKKEGPNKGRRFYRCGKKPSTCDFFSWAST